MWHHFLHLGMYLKIEINYYKWVNQKISIFDMALVMSSWKEKLKTSPIESLLEKRGADDAWLLENSPVGKMQVNIENRNKPSK